MRIVTLLPAATEMVCALGLEECLVGRSHECDFPAWVEKLPTLTRARVDSSLSSVEIDEQVQRLLSAGGPLYEVEESALAALDPGCGRHSGGVRSLRGVFRTGVWLCGACRAEQPRCFNWDPSAWKTFSPTSGPLPKRVE